jgi:hypothetical protein
MGYPPGSFTAVKAPYSKHRVWGLFLFKVTGWGRAWILWRGWAQPRPDRPGHPALAQDHLGRTVTRG